jgi:hypothetical protein
MNTQNPEKDVIIKIGELILNEENHSDCVHHFTGQLKDIIRGKIDVAYLKLNKEIFNRLEKYKIGVIPVRMVTQDTMMVIVYNDKVKGFKLYNIAKRNEGSLIDKTPEDAREIGQLLGYDEKKIQNYINKKYNLQEQNFPEFEKQIEKDIDVPGLNKRILFQEDDFKICAVNADFVRDNDPGLNFNGFTDGGSHYVTSLLGYKKWIPEDEIWVDDVFLSKPNDLGAIILHEMIERHLMKYYGVPYDAAHNDYAEKGESMFREKFKEGVSFDVIKNIYNDFVREIAEYHKLKKISKDYQFQKTKDLMNKVDSI